MVNASTICAISTPQGNGGVAMIRLSGPDAFSIIDPLLTFSIDSIKSHTVQFALLKKDAALIDEVVITKFIGPNSYTGENIIEITCHGSVYIQNEILKLLLSQGAQMASPGEFTMRAYLNKKMDLSQAEAVADLIASENASMHKMAMHQMRGGFSRDLKALRQQLIDFASLIELELDFSEEDVEFADRTQLHDLIKNVLSFIVKLIESFNYGNALKSGIPVAIIGQPNAGKSTLLNALLNEDRAIVSNIPGTTRDTIEEQLIIDGIKFRLIDTAGIRSSEDKIEQIGIERSYQSATKAQIVLFIYDADSLTPVDLDQEISVMSLTDQKVIFVSNKTDLNRQPFSADHIAISAHTGDGINNIKCSLSKAFAFEQTGDTIVSNLRHLEALEHALADLNKVEHGLQNGITGDFLAMDIRSALRHLGSITGEVSTDDLLGNIFGKFCIGK